MQTTAKKSSQITQFCLLLICLIATVITYRHVPTFQFTDWDDPGYVTDNIDVKEFNTQNFFTQTYIKLYTPLTLVSYATEYMFFGENPRVFHTTNLVLHLINMTLVFLLSNKLLQSSKAAFFVAFVFALHPLQVEPVCWISSRKDLLFSLFLLSAFLAYIRQSEQKSTLYLILSLSFFLLACLSKPTAFIFPSVLLAYEFLIRKEQWKPVLFRVIPFALISMATFGFGSYLLLIEGVSLEYKPGFTLFQNICLAAYSLAFYGIKFILPTGLSNFHAYPLAGPHALTVEHILAPFLLLSFLVAIFLCIQKKKNLIAFGLVFFLFMLLPTIKLYPSGYPVVAERYAYLALFGLMLSISAIVSPYFHFKTSRSILISSALGFLIIVMVFRTTSYSKTWKNSFTIWTNAIKQNPDHLQAYEHLAKINMNQGNKQAALKDFMNVIRIDPKNSDALNSSGNLLYELGEKEEGFKILLQAVKTGTLDYLPYYNLANIYKEKAEFKNAIQYYSMAIERKVDFHEAINNRGVCYILSGDTISAYADFKLAVQLSPQDEMYIKNKTRTSDLMGK